MIKEKINRRNLLKTTAIGAGALTFGSVEGALDTSIDNLIDPKILIARFKENFDKDTEFKKLANTEVVNKPGVTRMDYIYNYFLHNTAENLPSDIQETLAKLAIIGIPAQESRYHNGRTSRDSAKTLWQLTPIALKDLRRKGVATDNKEYLKESTRMAFAYFDKIAYPQLSDISKDVCEHFGLSDTDRVTEFTVLILMNAYNTGTTRMKRVLEQGLQMSPNEFSFVYDFVTPISLFNIISTAVDEKNSVRGYGKESREYVLKVIAGAQSLDNNSGKTYAPSTRQKIGGLVDKTLALADEELLKPAIAGAGGGAIGAAPTLIRKESRKDITRRDLIKGALLSTTLGITGSQLIKNTPLKLSDLPTLNDLLPDFDFIKETPSSGIEFSDGSIYNENYVRTQLHKYYEQNSKLFTNNTYVSTLSKNEQLNRELSTYRRNYTKMNIDLLMRQNVVDDKTMLFKNEVDIKTNAFYLSQIPETDELYRLRGVGMGTYYGPKNNMLYSQLSEKALPVLNEVTDRFQKELLKQGLSKDWTIRPIITSILRSSDKNASISGASTVSSHQYGMGFDISMTKFDLIDKQSNTFMMIDTNKKIASLENAIALVSNVTIARILIDMHKEERITLTYEPNTVHYHITVGQYKK